MFARIAVGAAKYRSVEFPGALCEAKMTGLLSRI